VLVISYWVLGFLPEYPNIDQRFLKSEWNSETGTKHLISRKKQSTSSPGRNEAPHPPAPSPEGEGEM
jgi:hypothetical protein